jgi:N-formylglutamate deformylase
VVLIDAHSVASRANLLHEALKDDVYLGDRDGRSNSGWLTTVMERGFRSTGLSVVRNKPYKGGYITEHYGQMGQVAALQIEMRWGLYLDEAHPERTPTHAKFGAFKSVLSDVFTGLLAEVNRRGRVSK